MIIHKMKERRCTCRRVPSSFSRKEGIRSLFVAPRLDRQNVGYYGTRDEPTTV
ncbi:hypothetical protein [Aneurinibacillus aneurinilyticus]|uniref:hypothetical protein n=1 Tax=Aneurinibacillus aneurinilyticus TaxID=1391 RepID=UPI003526253E